MKFVSMGKSKDAERKQARELYVNGSLTFKEIALIVKVAPAHIGRWAKEDGWDTQKSAQQVTSEKMIANYYAMLQKINKEVDDKHDGIPTTAHTDQISKLTDAIFKLNKKQSLSLYQQALKEFLEELHKNDVEAAKQFAPAMLDFLKRKAQQLAS